MGDPNINETEENINLTGIEGAFMLISEAMEHMEETIGEIEGKMEITTEQLLNEIGNQGHRVESLEKRMEVLELKVDSSFMGDPLAFRRTMHIEQPVSSPPLSVSASVPLSPSDLQQSFPSQAFTNLQSRDIAEGTIVDNLSPISQGHWSTLGMSQNTAVPSRVMFQRISEKEPIQREPSTSIYGTIPPPLRQSLNRTSTHVPMSIATNSERGKSIMFIPQPSPNSIISQSLATAPGYLTDSPSSVGQGIPSSLGMSQSVAAPSRMMSQNTFEEEPIQGEPSTSIYGTVPPALRQSLNRTSTQVPMSIATNFEREKSIMSIPQPSPNSVISRSLATAPGYLTDLPSSVGQGIPSSLGMSLSVAAPSRISQNTFEEEPIQGEPSTSIYDTVPPALRQSLNRTSTQVPMSIATNFEREKSIMSIPQPSPNSVISRSLATAPGYLTDSPSSVDQGIPSSLGMSQSVAAPSRMSQNTFEVEPIQGEPSTSIYGTVPPALGQSLNRTSTLIPPSINTSFQSQNSTSSPSVHKLLSQIPDFPRSFATTEGSLADSRSSLRQGTRSTLGISQRSVVSSRLTPSLRVPEEQQNEEDSSVSFHNSLPLNPLPALNEHMAQNAISIDSSFGPGKTTPLSILCKPRMVSCIGSQDTPQSSKRTIPRFFSDGSNVCTDNVSKSGPVQQYPYAGPETSMVETLNSISYQCKSYYTPPDTVSSIVSPVQQISMDRTSTNAPMFISGGMDPNTTFSNQSHSHSPTPTQGTQPSFIRQPSLSSQQPYAFFPPDDSVEPSQQERSMTNMSMPTTSEPFSDSPEVSRVSSNSFIAGSNSNFLPSQHIPSMSMDAVPKYPLRPSKEPDSFLETRDNNNNALLTPPTSTDVRSPPTNAFREPTNSFFNQQSSINSNENTSFHLPPTNANNIVKHVGSTHPEKFNTETSVENETKPSDSSQEEAPTNADLDENKSKSE